MRTYAGVVVVLASLAGGAKGQDAVEVTDDATNVRAGPSTGDRVVGQAGAGQVYAVLGKQGAWTRVQFADDPGWIHESLLTATRATVLQVSAGTLNVRAGAGTRFRDLGDLHAGDLVAVRSSSGSWKRVDFAGREAWVHGSYLAPRGSTVGPTRARSSAGFIELPASGPGYFSYAPASRRWGTPTMVYGLERIGARWQREQPGAPPMGVGDISLRNGGDITGHVSHEKGVDVDVRPMAKGATFVSVTRFSSSYSRTRTAALIRMFKAELPTTLTLFNDTQIPGTTRWPNHDNHFHVRIRR